VVLPSEQEQGGYLLAVDELKEIGRRIERIAVLAADYRVWEWA